MKNRCATFGLLLVLVTVAFSSTAQAQRRRQATPGKEPPHPPKVGEVAPEFELMDLKGEKVSLKELTKESPVVMLGLRFVIFGGGIIGMGLIVTSLGLLGLGSARVLTGMN
ncbi:thioredoxin domain-containing protein [Novipirellula artificiosorum]|uniref:Uncharacterized protein n=1 Tax=Novipirellula artificiosorum TaxID=2528016 RepID=A0A5C6DVE2_9BACT|nr:hypothetical protein [Novipirellula artificiosorum]TWU40578.1 hypothetical protein Poly41_14110 [Novipirellula artificiosorum]